MYTKDWGLERLIHCVPRLTQGFGGVRLTSRVENLLRNGLEVFLNYGMRGEVAVFEDKTINCPWKDLTLVSL